MRRRWVTAFAALRRWSPSSSASSPSNSAPYESRSSTPTTRLTGNSRRDSQPPIAHLTATGHTATERRRRSARYRQQQRGGGRGRSAGGRDSDRQWREAREVAPTTLSDGCERGREKRGEERYSAGALTATAAGGIRLSRGLAQLSSDLRLPFTAPPEPAVLHRTTRQPAGHMR